MLRQFVYSNFSFVCATCNATKIYIALNIKVGIIRKAVKRVGAFFHFLNQPSGINNIPFRQRHAHSSMLMNTSPQLYKYFFKNIKNVFL